MRSSDDFRIGFLLSLAALPLAACPSDDEDATASDDDDDSTGADDDGMTMTDPSVTMTADDSGSSGPSSVDDSTGSSGPDPATDGSESGSSGTGETGADSSTGGVGLCPEEPEVPEVCTDFAAHFVKCDPDSAGEEASIALECACYLGYYAPSYGESCGTAVEDYYTCLVTADCKEILAETACADEGMAVDMECV